MTPPGSLREGGTGKFHTCPVNAQECAMSIEYNYDDPDKLWPCLGPMTNDELDSEWFRCWRILKACGDREIKPWQKYWLSERVRSTEAELLNRQFLSENHERLLQGKVFPSGVDVEKWRYEKFMDKAL